MNIKLKQNLFAVLLCALAFTANVAVASQPTLFNEGWLFAKGEQSGAESPSFNDSTWRTLNLPHDWAIEGPFDIKYNARCGGLPFHGVGWYRRTFTANKEWRNKIVRLYFEGAMSDSKVWINGELVSDYPSGYMGFEIDMSQHLKYGEENVIAVELSPKDLSSRWYPGAGIYRDVWLSVDERVYVPQWGVYVSTPTVTDSKAVVQIETDVINRGDEDGKFVVEQSIVDADGEIVAKFNNTLSLKSGERSSVIGYVDVLNPRRWRLLDSYLYTAITTISCGDKVLDTYTTRFGIRNIEYNKSGFFVNGEKVQFQGVCLHQDNGPLGVAFNRRADERKLQMMIDMGVNAIRTTHNPFAPEFLDLCDEMGLLVIDEMFDEWKIGKVENGYNLHFDEWADHDLTSLIRRDRNHPSIIMWSIGNEIMEQTDKEQGFVVTKFLADICRREDPTRPSTMGLNYYPNPYDNNMAQQVDIVGINYKAGKYDEIHKNYPDLLIYGSETSSCTGSRGVYHLPIEKYEKHESLQVTSYELIGPPWAYPGDFEFASHVKNPYVMGEFVWTGFDYLGEPTPYGGNDHMTHGKWNADWPSRSSYFGAVDLCGLKKDRYYLYQSQWTTEPMIHFLPHWNWSEGMTIPVHAYTNCDEAELFLNGKSLGRKVKGRDLATIKLGYRFYDKTEFDSPYRLVWEDVPYEAGTICIKGYRGGELVAESSVSTAGEPYRVTLTPDRKVISADGLDLCYVTVRIEDKQGNLCPMADNLVEFSVGGTAHFKAVGNGNAATTESFIEPRRKAFSGMCMLIIESSKGDTGTVKIKATSNKLRSATTTIQTK